MPTNELVYANGSAMIVGNLPLRLAPLADMNPPHDAAAMEVMSGGVPGMGTP